jgi:uncharacterized membrane protein
MEILEWLGRFHPVVVHLPIGMILLGIFLLILSDRKPEWQLNTPIRITFFCSLITAAVAAAFGWILAWEGGYDLNTLRLHRWLGIGVVLFSGVLWMMHRKPRRKSKSILFSSILITGLLIFTGHNGGKLTHGEAYLWEQAPTFVKNWISFEERTAYPEYTDPDSCLIFEDLVYPVLWDKCGSCHNNKVAKGGLNIETGEALLEGGRNGSVVETSVNQSELFKRITMDPQSRKFMPPKGAPMSYQEINLLAWWIEEGVPMGKPVSQTQPSDEIKQILLSRHNLDTKPKTFLEKTKVARLDSSVILELNENGFKVIPLSVNSNFLDVKWSPGDSASLRSSISLLTKASAQITWLDLQDAQVEDDMLTEIGQLKNLLRLRLNKNPITDKGIEQLRSLSHLESLNLYGTNITDVSLDILSGLQSLKRLYVWQTQVTQAGANKLKISNPHLEVILGISFE